MHCFPLTHWRFFFVFSFWQSAHHLSEMDLFECILFQICRASEFSKCMSFDHIFTNAYSLPSYGLSWPNFSMPSLFPTDTWTLRALQPELPHKGGMLPPISFSWDSADHSKNDSCQTSLATSSHLSISPFKESAFSACLLLYPIQGKPFLYDFETSQIPEI